MMTLQKNKAGRRQRVRRQGACCQSVYLLTLFLCGFSRCLLNLLFYLEGRLVLCSSLTSRTCCTCLIGLTETFPLSPLLGFGVWANPKIPKLNSWINIFFLPLPSNIVVLCLACFLLFSGSCNLWICIESYHVEGVT